VFGLEEGPLAISCGHGYAQDEFAMKKEEQTNRDINKTREDGRTYLRKKRGDVLNAGLC